jgi:tetratricopeptide (TPR) repeat protein
LSLELGEQLAEVVDATAAVDRLLLPRRLRGMRRPMLRKLALALLAAADLACAALAPPLTPPERGGAGWIRMTSAHFVLETDVEPYRARDVIAGLEQSHAALAYVTSRPPRAAETPVEVVLFARPRDFTEIRKRSNASAWFSPALAGDFEPQPVIVMVDSDLVEERRLIVQHELTHRFLHERFPALPRWVDEGLADYHASARAEEGRIVLGSASLHDFTDLPYAWVSLKQEGFEQSLVPAHLAPTLRDLLEAGRDEFYLQSDEGGPARKQALRQAALYTGAWKLVHFLRNGAGGAYRPRFEAYLADLQRGVPSRAAFEARFGADRPALEEAFRGYVRQDRLQLAIAPYTAPTAPPAPASQPMRADEVHVLWARLLPWTKDEQPRVEAQLEAALAVAPSSPEALLRRALLAVRREDLDRAAADVARALAARPDDPRVLFAEVVVRGDRSRRGGAPAEREAVEAAVERLSRVAVSAAQLNEVAWERLRKERLDEGLALSTRAIGADPLCWSCLDTHAMLLLRQGKLDEAARAMERALSAAPEGLTVTGMLEHRRLIEQRRAEKKAP